MNSNASPDLIVHNGRITTLDPKCPEATNLAVENGRIVGVNDAEEYQPGANTKVIDLKGRRVIPGLNDSHLHVIRGGLNYNMELRWDGVPSLADGLRMLKEQAERTPPGQWVRVVGGWNEFQFAERRMPTLDEINAAAPDTARRRNSAGQQRQSHWPAHRASERDNSLLHARQRSKAPAGAPDEFHAPFHARTESPGAHEYY